MTVEWERWRFNMYQNIYLKKINDPKTIMIVIHKYFTLRINIYEFFSVIQFTTIWLDFTFSVLISYLCMILLLTLHLYGCVSSSRARAYQLTLCLFKSCVQGKWRPFTLMHFKMYLMLIISSSIMEYTGYVINDRFIMHKLCIVEWISIVGNQLIVNVTSYT